MSKVEQAVYGFRRHLRKEFNSKDRELPFYTSICKKNCAGFQTGTCLATKCVGYRRQLATNEDRDLQTAMCENQITSTNQKLNNLVSSNAVSEGCQAVLQAPRSVSCYNDVIFGEIESFSMVTVGRNGVTRTNIESGATVCRNAYVDTVAIPCVEYANFLLTGPNGYRKESNNVCCFTITRWNVQFGGHSGWFYIQTKIHDTQFEGLFQLIDIQSLCSYRNALKVYVYVTTTTTIKYNN
jgi:hypothetical protein